MQGSNVIVAINKDANAPIFEFTDLGVVGDLHQVVPKLTELVRARKSGSWAPSPLRYPPPCTYAGCARPSHRRRADRGRDPDRRRRPRGSACAIRLGQLIEEEPDDGRAPRRRAGRGAREGQAARLAPALRRGRQPARAAAPVQGPQAASRHAVLRRGRPRIRLLPDAVARVPDPGAADDAEPRELRRLALAARPLPRAGSRGRGRDDPPGDARR